MMQRSGRDTRHFMMTSLDRWDDVIILCEVLILVTIMALVVF